MKFISLFLIISFLQIFVLFSIWKLLQNDDDDDNCCIVETTMGRIRGKQNRTLFEKKLFYSFRGIPFAKPPIDQLRFKAPQINDPWPGTFDAFEFGNDCYQYIISDKNFDGFEDCLYLNVYVPTNTTEIDRTAKLPVIFYIYGGGYIFGTASDYAPDFLMEEDVIVVTSNHRAGPFGFLALPLPEYSGNMGLKDQSLALRWVHENIDYFGGDKNRITVFGHSAGSVATHMHMLSPLSNQLFQRAIMLSGPALGHSSTREELSSIIYDLAKKLNYSVSNEHDLIKFLHEVDAKFFLNKTKKFLFKSDNGSKAFNHRWTPTVEAHDAVNPFLTESPKDILLNPKYKSHIDTLFSRTAKEWVFTDEQLQPDLLKIVDQVFQFDLPMFYLIDDFNSEIYKNISKRIRDFYFDGKPIYEVSLNRLNTLISDTFFNYGIDLSARIQSKRSTGRTIFAKFTAENDWNLSARNRNESNYTTHFATHSDQVFYYFWSSRNTSNEIYLNLKNDSLQRKLIKSVASFYANFAKFGSVTPNSKQIEFNVPGSNQFKYYKITNDGIFVHDDEERDRFDFWDKIFNEYKHNWNITFDFQTLE